LVLETHCIVPATRKAQVLTAQDAEMALGMFAAGHASS
jgi:hypothetical protein